MADVVAPELAERMRDRNGGAPSQSLRDHDGPDNDGPGDQQQPIPVTHQSPAADRNARDPFMFGPEHDGPDSEWPRNLGGAPVTADRRDCTVCGKPLGQALIGAGYTDHGENVASYDEAEKIANLTDHGEGAQ